MFSQRLNIISEMVKLMYLKLFSVCVFKQGPWLKLKIRQCAGRAGALEQPVRWRELIFWRLILYLHHCLNKINYKTNCKYEGKLYLIQYEYPVYCVLMKNKYILKFDSKRLLNTDIFICYFKLNWGFVRYVNISEEIICLINLHLLLAPGLECTLSFLLSLQLPCYLSILVTSVPLSLQFPCQLSSLVISVLLSLKFPWYFSSLVTSVPFSLQFSFFYFFINII